jgi:para-nitrobenzyl esterase
MSKSGVLLRLAICAMLVQGVVQAGSPIEAVRVRTEQGVVRGELRPGLRVFQGIPYGAPPVGERRWQPTQPPLGRQGELDATRPRGGCTMIDGQKMADGKWLKRGGADFFLGVPLLAGTSEDCLYLNIWAPIDAQGAPVMVWLQANGPASNPVFDGAAFARDGVILVTLDYRQLSLGNFAHPALTAEVGGKAPLARFQTMDQLEALRWVKRNIAAFGGNAGNVTVFGQSASAASVLQMLTLPEAKGLIDKAIVQSGSGWWTPFSLAQMERIGSAIATRAGLPGKEATADQLRALPLERLTQVGVYNIDGRQQRLNATDAIAKGRLLDVPLMIGFTGLDGSSLREITPEEVARRAPPELLTAYGSDGLTGADLGYRLYTDQHAAAPARWIARNAAKGAPAYLYQFSYVLSLQRSRNRGATHGSELPFVFDSWSRISAQLKLSDEDQAVTRLMHSCWVSFAKLGRPQCEGAPEWPAYSVKRDALMDLDAKPQLRTRFRKAQLDAQEKDWNTSREREAREAEEVVRKLERGELE